MASGRNDSGRPDAAALDHLFRREAGRLVSTLTRVFGVRHLALAQDVVQDVFCRALEVWKFSGVPDNPSAWLAAAARNRAIDVLRHEQTVRRLEPEVAGQSPVVVAPELPTSGSGIFLRGEIPDDELRMMFSCCPPDLGERARVSLILHVLCGFSVREIAAAFLEREAACGKRVQRARIALAGKGALFEIADAASLRDRLPSVHRALYLLFNEGYHGSHPEQMIRGDLCEEAARLCALLAEHPATACPATFALLALMCLGAARLPARLDAGGELCDLDAQDRSKWNRALIDRGLAFLARSASGDDVTPYHLEAAIAAEHAFAPSAAATNWRRVVELYDGLASVAPGPVVRLNRAIAIGMAEGPERGLDALSEVGEAGGLDGYPFYEAALGEFSWRAGRNGDAHRHFTRALGSARASAERRFLQGRLALCLRQGA
jgi:RNA polymerase sigma factor (sigma-70 family)